MPVQITELTFLDQLARRFSLPAPEHLGVEAVRGDIRKAKWGGRGIVKADVMSGEQGKAGAVHGGNGAKAAHFLIETFKDANLVDPYEPGDAVSAEKIAKAAARKFKKIKDAAREAGVDYERIPCVGRPVYNKAPVNCDPCEHAVYRFIAKSGKYNIFLDHQDFGSPMDMRVPPGECHALTQSRELE